MTALTSVDVAGGQALGLARLSHQALVEIDEEACATLRLNRPGWDVIEDDIRSPEVLRRAESEWYRVDLLAGGVPCPPFSVAGKQLGEDDERDLFPAMLELARLARPRAVLIENVRGLISRNSMTIGSGSLTLCRTWGMRSGDGSSITRVTTGCPNCVRELP